jgi:hypothetical protein
MYALMDVSVHTVTLAGPGDGEKEIKTTRTLGDGRRHGIQQAIIVDGGCCECWMTTKIYDRGNRVVCLDVACTYFEIEAAGDYFTIELDGPIYRLYACYNTSEITIKLPVEGLWDKPTVDWRWKGPDGATYNDAILFDGVDGDRFTAIKNNLPDVFAASCASMRDTFRLAEWFYAALEVIGGDIHSRIDALTDLLDAAE